MPSYNLGKASGVVEIKTAESQRNLEQLKKRQQEMTAAQAQMATAVRRTNRVLFGVAGALVSGLGLAIKTAAKFEKSISAYAAVTGIAGKELDAVREKALQIGRDTSFSASEAADAIVELGKAGLTTSQILEGAADAVVALSEAGDIGISEAATVAANAMAQFQLNAKDLPTIVDQLAGAANASTIGVSDLAESFVYAGSTASSLKVPFSDVNTALAILGNNGLRGSVAGTAVRGMLLGLRGETPKAVKVLKELGIVTEDGANAFYTAEGSVKSLAEISEILRVATKDLSDEARTTALNILFGDRAMSAAVVLARDGEAAFTDMAKAINKVKAADVARERLNNLSGAIKIFRGSLETALIQAGSPAQDALKGIVEGATRLVNAFAALNPETQKTIVKTLALVAGFSLGLAVLQKMLGPMFRLRRALVALQTQKALGGAAQNMGKFSQILGKLGLNPVALGVLALGGAIFYLSRKTVPLVKNLKDLKDASDDVKVKEQAYLDTLKPLAAAQERVRVAQERVNGLRKDGKTRTQEYKDAVNDLKNAENDLAEAQRNNATAGRDAEGARRKQLEVLDKTLTNISQPSFLEKAANLFKKAVNQNTKVATGVEALKLDPTVAEQMLKLAAAAKDADIPVSTVVQRINELDVDAETKKGMIDAFVRISGAMELAGRHAITFSKALGVELSAGVGLEAINSALATQKSLLTGSVKEYGNLSGKSEAVSASLKELVTLMAEQALAEQTNAASMGISVDASEVLRTRLSNLKAEYPLLAAQIDLFIAAINKTPPKVVTEATVETQAAEAKLADLRAKLQDMGANPQLIRVILREERQYTGGRVPGLARGGAVRKGKVYKVGERGEELFVSSEDGTILPNRVLRGLDRSPVGSAAPAAAMASAGRSGSSLKGLSISGTLTLDKKGNAILRGVIVDEIEQSRLAAGQLARMGRNQ